MTVTIVTGASSGIGRCLAKQLAAKGDPVALLARRQPLLESLAEEIAADGGRALALTCDVTDADQVGTTFAEVESKLGPIDRLIANAGGGETTPIDGFRAAHIEDALAVNVMGTAICIEAVLPGMLERGSGHLVATSSPVAFRGLPTAAGYSAAKAALTNMLESLRIELRPRGIDVTLLFPGFVKTKPGGSPSSRRKPFRIDAEEAARIMASAIDRRVTSLVFPPSIAALIRVAGLLPDGLYDRVLGAIAARRS